MVRPGSTDKSTVSPLVAGRRRDATRAPRRWRVAPCRVFYRARAAITRRLIERHGFTIVAVEADWPDAARIDAYVRHHAAFPGKERAFARFPTWMWRNVEVRDFVQWLRAENEHRPPERRAEFRGLDVYSLNASIDAVLRYLDNVDPDAANEARGRYGCLSPWQSDPARYGRAVATGISGLAMRRSSTSCGTFSDTGSTTSTAAPRCGRASNPRSRAPRRSSTSRSGSG